jgi:hypothetical protein
MSTFPTTIYSAREASKANTIRVGRLDDEDRDATPDAEAHDDEPEEERP